MITVSEQQFTPTEQQVNVTESFCSSLDQKSISSIFLNAVAGSGKTSTIMLQVRALKEIEACSVSFNTNIRDASALKLQAMGSSVQAKTTNQLGRSILVAAAKDGLCRMPKGGADTGKYRTIIESRLFPCRYDRDLFPKPRDYSKAVTAVCTLVDAVRATQVDPSNRENLLDIIYHYDLHEKIDVEANWWDLAASEVGAVIEQGIKDYQRNGVHDFNDQISLPLYLNVASPIYDIIFIDEAQDLNRARLEMITRSIKPSGTLFFVGDPKQAIQGFTFADTDSVGTIQRVTSSTEFPLSVCWRCDGDIVRLAQVLVPHIQARPNAEAGIVSTIEQSELIKLLESKEDLVLCRVNAPLAKYCLETIRAGKRAIVRGRDIGKSVVNFLEDILPVDDFEELHEGINEYVSTKSERLWGKKGAEQKLAELEDKAETLRAFIDGYLDTLLSSRDADMEKLKLFIESKFSDNNVDDSIVFSTIHKAKGLEYDRVFILEPKLLPHPAAKGGWQSDQEKNIIYVAVTRAKNKLYFVGGVPACLKDMYNAINCIEACTQEVLPENEVQPSKEISCAHNQIEGKAKGGKREGAGRKRKADLKHVSVKLSDRQIELTKDIDRSALLRQLLNVHYNITE